jgi:hypothetical protein
MNGNDWVRIQGEFNRTIGPVAPFIIGTTVVANAAPLIFDHDFKKAPAWLTALGLALNVASIVTTMIGNVPVNDVTESANPDAPPADWRDLRSRWETFHTARSVSRRLPSF